MTAVRTQFIAPMLDVYGEPKTDNPAGFFAQLEADLAPYAPAVLAKAVAYIRRNRVFPDFPVHGVCVEACEKCSPPAKPRVVENDHAVEFDPAFRRALTRCACPLGRQADDERWLPSLVAFVATHDALPEGREIGALRLKGADADARIVECEADGREHRSALFRVVDDMRRRMLDRTSRLVFGDTGLRHALVFPIGRDQAAADLELERLLALRDSPLPGLSRSVAAKFGVQATHVAHDPEIAASDDPSAI